MAAESASWPGLLLIADRGELRVCEDLLGKRFFDFVKHGDDVLVACGDGCRIVNQSRQVTPYASDVFCKLSAGSTFFVAVTPEAKLYSWGIEGGAGQLGQGISRKECTDPKPINFNTSFVDVRSGEAFSIAIDKSGAAYSFGENFSRQLGLYTKPKENMHIKCAMIEDMVFIPRLVPFTMQHPIAKVSCGLRFAMAITKDGKLFSWGAGESGQLGTGRCTHKEIPSAVGFDSPSPVLDVACGQGHTIAVLKNGALYAWGLNQRGQLGVGDIKARHLPAQVALPDAQIRQLCADEHSSAAIDANGELYTWGSADHGRLLTAVPQPPPSDDPRAPQASTCLRQPSKVHSTALEGMRIEKFVFTKSSAAVLVRATLTGAWPLKGPKRHFSRLQLHGFGLWDSPQILVKFSSHVESMYNPPRSAMGRLSADGSIVCKPPKFAEVGWYRVSLSMDGGGEFFAQTFDVLVYKEPAVLHQHPAVIDLRERTIPSLRLTVQGSSDIATSTAVKLAFFRTKTDELHSPFPHSPTRAPSTPAVARGPPQQSVAEIFVPAHVEERRPPTADPATDAPLSARTVESSGKRAGTTGGEPIFHLVTEALALPADLAACLHDLSCQLSFNDQDFTGGAGGKAEAPSSLCHAFTPLELVPGSYALKELQRLAALRAADEDDAADSELSLHEFERKVTVRGESFFPPGKLAKGAHIKGVWCGCRAAVEQGEAPAGTVKAETEVPAAIESIDPLLVHCDDGASMHFTLTGTCLAQMHAHMQALALLPTPRGVQMDLLFQLETAPPAGGGAAELVTLSSRPVSLFFYSDPKLRVQPALCRRGDVPMAFELCPVGAEGFPFNPLSAAVQVHFANDALPPITFSSKELRSVPIYAPDPAANPDADPDADLSATEGGRGKPPALLVEDLEREPMAFRLALTLPSFADLYQAHPGVEQRAPPRLSLAVALDGQCFSAPENAATVLLYSGLARYTLQPAAPKGGFPPGASVGLVLEEYCPAQPAGMAVVRLYGASEEAAITVSATMSETTTARSTTTLQFTLPDGPTLAKLGPVLQGKEKLLHVAVSVDGGLIFDKPDAPLLQVK